MSGGTKDWVDAQRSDSHTSTTASETVPPIVKAAVSSAPREDPAAADWSPPACAPFVEVGSFGPQSGVVAVAGVDPGVVWEPVEDLLHDAMVEGVEAFRVLPGVSYAAREQAVPGDEVRTPVGVGGVPVEQGDGAGGVADQVDGGQLDVVDADDVAVVDQMVRGHGDAVGVVAAGVGGGPGGGHDVGEGLPVVAVLVGGDDRGEPAVPDEGQEGAGLVGGVDEDLGAGGLRPEEVSVVVVGADGDLGQRQGGQVADVGRAADGHGPGVLGHGVISSESGGGGRVVVRARRFGAS